MHGQRNIKTRCRKEYSIRIDYKETGWEGLDLVDQAYDKDRRWAVVNSVMNLLLP